MATECTDRFVRSFIKMKTKEQGGRELESQVVQLDV